MTDASVTADTGYHHDKVISRVKVIDSAQVSGREEQAAILPGGGKYNAEALCLPSFLRVHRFETPLMFLLLYGHIFIGKPHGRAAYR